MKIFIDVRSLYAAIISGVPEYARLMIKSLAAEAPNEEFLFFANQSGKRAGGYPLENEVAGKWLNYGVPNKIWSTASRLFNLPKIDKIVPADVYWSPHLDILSFKNPRKHVLTIHDLSFVLYPEFFTRKKNFWHWRQNYEKQIREAGRIVAVSEFTRRSIIERFGIEEKRIICIYPGVNDRYREPEPDEKRIQEFREAKGVDFPFLLQVGTLEPRKNAIGTIRAFNLLKQQERFRNLRLILVGAKGWLYEQILAEAEDSPFRGDIVIWGRAAEDDLFMLYHLASAFVYPSFFEGFAFPCLEAQACGTPVVTSDRGPMPEVLGESAVLVNPWKTYELALAIERILVENKTKERLVAAGRKNAERFRWGEAAEKLLETFRAVA